MQHSKQPGFWESALTEQDAVAAGVEYSQLQLADNGDLYWVEQRPNEGGRCCICYESLDSGKIEDITPSQFSVRSRVHEYGGRSWCLLDDALVFVNAQDQQIYKQSLSQEAVIDQLTDLSKARFIEPVWDQHSNRLITVQEVHDANGVINRIVSVSLQSGKVEVLVEGADFYAYPVLDSSGTSLAYISWSHPEQPWTATQLSLLDLTKLDAKPVVLAGLDCEEALSQPYFSQSDQLHVVTDRNGWWNIYHYDFAKAKLVLKHSNDADMISAPWQSGLTHYAECSKGIAHILHKHAGGEIVLDECCLASEFSYFKALVANNGWVCAAASAADRLNAVIRIDIESHEVKVVRGGDAPLQPLDCSLPRPMSFSQGKEQCFGYLYPATNKGFDALCGDKSPLVIFLHGGPTAATYPVLNLKIQYWTLRGFAVLDLNYRGSANYGREYRDALAGSWGVIESEDIRSAIEQLTDSGEIDPDAIFVRGNSSGGFSALNAVCQLDCFAAAASLYGVTDPLVLDQCTHKFESYYLHWLLGDPQKESKLYAQRAPLTNVSMISCPIVFFQGEQDKVVLPEQTRAMVGALSNRGGRSGSVLLCRRSSWLQECY